MIFYKNVEKNKVQQALVENNMRHTSDISIKLWS